MIFYNQILKNLEKNAVPQANGCIHVASNRSEKSYHCFSVNFRKNTNIPLSHLVLATTTGEESDICQLVDVAYKGKEVSHLCHATLCVNRDHLLVEPSFNNRLCRWCNKLRLLGVFECVCGNETKCILTGSLLSKYDLKAEKEKLMEELKKKI